jgi:16S rRNA (cytidine1402-2'-O)-methyltransferase
VGEQCGTLWIVATPIGSLQDLGARARELLEHVDLILAEDTRRTRGLLSNAGIRPGRRLLSLHERNEARRVPEIMTRLESGVSVALVSDAGTPVLSDPGYLLVRAARERNFRVNSVPGASAFTAALAAAGQPPLPAVLVGFLPAKRGPRRRRLQEFVHWQNTLVALLSPHRLGDELEDLANAFGGDRPATLMAEISKIHERATVGTLGELATGNEVNRPRGEYVLVVGPRLSGRDPIAEVRSEDVRAAYNRLVDGGADRRQAIKSVAATCGIGRRQVFDLLIDDEPDGQ